jgi:hypothetical protein
MRRSAIDDEKDHAPRASDQPLQERNEHERAARNGNPLLVDL